MPLSIQIPLALENTASLRLQAHSMHHYASSSYTSPYSGGCRLASKQEKGECGRDIQGDSYNLSDARFLPRDHLEARHGLLLEGGYFTHSTQVPRKESNVQ